MPTVLIADDDLRLLKMLQRTLVYENLHVLTASDGAEAFTLVQRYSPDLLIVDWMMPKMDGLTLVRCLREGEEGMPGGSPVPAIPILMLTARDAIENRVEGLESGADDYLVKPFAPAELVARVHALLRRSPSSQPKLQPLSYAGITLDLLTHEVHRDEIPLTLTLTEFKLLHFLLRHPRQVLERSQILTEVWGYDFGGDDNVLEIYIGYLRKKLEANGGERLIQTMRGVGYTLRKE